MILADSAANAWIERAPTRTPEIFVTVDVVILALRDDDLQVLLVKRKLPPFEGKWAIPGGALRVDESLEEGALRTLREKTGVTNVHLEQLYTFGALDRDPRGRTITIAYYALVPAPLAVQAGQGTTDAQWQSVYALPEMAFDHEEIVKYALKRLRYKLEYTAVGFRLLPETFTLSQLQRAYETILGVKLDKRNFRRRILQARVLEETGEYRLGEGRPARLYRYRADAVAEIKARRLFP
ncbi:MAG: NUDIX hydrolase [Thermoflexales bacterium]|nr:NUDIX hydrolase [Thermoflexales bacterium]MCS7325154.1 NUDIX hydrolase [Thermoflexales bacterium]MCX7938713.1 NUDIX hydrolase [Thermoflexales bacterium]MDW8054447.1 NUDIX domain-containing protein [Anaerolineae bacterium]MDW8292763.1 NUDIX domain-containing protein [Anaerolineae bacterium]